MVGKNKKVVSLLLAAGLVAALFSASAGPKPAQKGDVVRLIKAKSVQMNNGAVLDGFCSLSYAELDVDSIFE